MFGFTVGGQLAPAASALHAVCELVRSDPMSHIRISSLQASAPAMQDNTTGSLCISVFSDQWAYAYADEPR